MYRDAAAGGGGVVDRDHAWHDFARQWQTPEPGDRVMDEVMAPDIAAGILVQSSVPPDIAVDVAAAVGDRMRIGQHYRLRLGGCFSLSRVCSWPVRRVYGRPFFLGPGQRPKSCSRLQTLYGERRP